MSNDVGAAIYHEPLRPEPQFPLSQFQSHTVVTTWRCTLGTWMEEDLAEDVAVPLVAVPPTVGTEAPVLGVVAVVDVEVAVVAGEAVLDGGAVAELPLPKLISPGRATTEEARAVPK